MRFSFTVLTLSLFLAALPAASGEEEEPAVASGGDVEVLVEQTVLVLGKDEGTGVSLAPPPDAREVAIFAQHGRVDGITLLEDGRVEARYSPPTQFIPRVDVIAARVETTTGVSWGYTSVHLVGQGMAEIKTSPKALATIEIGDRSFGPVRADRKGKAKIRVQVPPGISEGVDGEGRAVDLHLPGVSRVAVFAGKQRIEDGETTPLDLFVVVLSPKGLPDRDSIPVVSSEGGAVTTPEPMVGETWRASFVGDDDASGLVKIQVIVDGEDLPPAAVSVVLEEGSAAAQDAELLAIEQEEAQETVPPPPPPPPVEDEPSVYLGLTGGYSWNFGSMHGPSASLEGAWILPTESRALSLGLRLGFTTSGGDSGSAQTASTESRTWIIHLAVEAAYRFELSTRWSMRLFVDGGAAMIDNSLESTFAGDARVEDHERKYAGTVGGGMEFGRELGPGEIFFRLDYLYLIGELETISGNPSPATAALGYRLFF